MENRDKLYWEERASMFGLKAGGNKDLVKYRHEEKLRLSAFDRTVKLQEITRVLDVGAGVGNWCFHFEKRRCNVAGIDISREMVALAKGQAERRGSQVVFMTSSIQDFDSSVEEFDLVTAITVLQHITDDQHWNLAITNMARLVRTGGYIVICENILSPTGIREICANYIKQRKRAEYICAFGANGCTLRKEIGVLIVGFRLYDLYCGWESRISSRLRRISAFVSHREFWRKEDASGSQSHSKENAVGPVGVCILRTSGSIDCALSHLPFIPRRYFKTTLMMFQKA